MCTQMYLSTTTDVLGFNLPLSFWVKLSSKVHDLRNDKNRYHPSCETRTSTCA